MISLVYNLVYYNWSTRDRLLPSRYIYSWHPEHHRTGDMEEEEEPEQRSPGRRFINIKIEGETESRRDRQKWSKTGYTAAHALHQRTKQPRITNIPLVADLFFH